MKKIFDLNTITSAIYLISVLSIECFAVIYLSLGILLLPALTSAFLIGKDVIYRRFDVYDSITKRFFGQLKKQLVMLRYFPIQLIMIMQALGIYASNKIGSHFLLYLLIPSIAFMMTLVVYLITYHVFHKKMPEITEVIIAMFYKVQYMISVWVIMLLVLYFLRPAMLGIFLIAGEIMLLGTESVAFIGITSYKKAKDELGEEDTEYFSEEFLKRL